MIITIIVVLLFILFMWKVDTFKFTAVTFTLWLFAIFGLAVILLLGIIFPLQGYEKPVLEEEIELVSINVNQEDEPVYVIKSNGAYSYMYEGGKYYKIERVPSEYVIEEKSKDCKKPVLKIYYIKARKGIWSFAKGCDKTTYVFYVPEGTIAKAKN